MGHIIAWLDPLARAIDARPDALAIFFRDDDAGWADDRLLALLDVCGERACPIDLAAIPMAVGDALAAALHDRVGTGASIGLHQHGFSHQNHEAEGRPCEFGPSRSAAAQRDDIAAGRRALLARFGPALDPIFTPPWNRCTAATASCLRENGITGISRDRSAGRLNVAGVAECPIGVDWFARSNGTRLSREQWAERAADAIADTKAPLGIMLHHARMDRDERRALADLMQGFAASTRVRHMLMREAVGVTGGAST